MEWCEFPNMKHLILQGAEDSQLLIPKIIGRLARVWVFEQQGYVHRDIKPENFLVAANGDVKLIDLGLATKIRPNWLARLLTRRSKVQGTRSYMSPEQIRGAALDQRADVYSFGCTIHELVSGKPPFTGASSDELLTKHLKTPPPSLDVVNPNITPEFAQLVRRTLAKDPAGRPNTIGEFLEEFRQCRVFRLVPSPITPPGSARQTAG